MFYFLILLIIVSFAIGAISLAPFVPTFSKDLKRINKLCNLKKGEKFIEIGCGTGKVSSYIAKNNPDVNVIGVEMNFFLYLYSLIKSKILGLKNLYIRFGNALKYDYSAANIVYIFGVPDTVSGKIKDKVYNEIPKNGIYMSYVFEVKGWNGKTFCDKPKKDDNNIYVCIK